MNPKFSESVNKVADLLIAELLKEGVCIMKFEVDEAGEITASIVKPTLEFDYPWESYDS